MTNLWHSFIAYWAIPLASWIFGTFTGAAFRWRYHSYKEWRAERQAKLKKKTDSHVLTAMANPALWEGPRPVTGAGVRPVKSDEMAEYLGLSQDDVADSFERLEQRGRVKQEKGTINDPAPSWFIVLR